MNERHALWFCLLLVGLEVAAEPARPPVRALDATGLKALALDIQKQR